jgi:hypothetical protein
MQSHRPTLALRLLVMLFLIVPGVILLAVALVGGEPAVRAVCAGIGGPLLLVGLGLWWMLARSELTISDEDVRRKTAFSDVRLRWDEIADYRYRGMQIHAGAHFGLLGALVQHAAASRTSGAPEQIALTLHGRDGRKLRITSNWRDAEEAALTCLERAESRGLGELRARLASGAPVEIGPVVLEKDGLSCKGKSIALGEIKNVYLASGRFGVKKNGKLLPFFTVDSAKVPAIFLLLDALRARGVDAPDARPGRAANVVSSAGYQIPRR